MKQGVFLAELRYEKRNPLFFMSKIEHLVRLFRLDEININILTKKASVNLSFF